MVRAAPNGWTERPAEPFGLVIDEALVTQVMAARGAPAELSLAKRLQVARSPQHKLAATLLSCWAAADLPLPPGGPEELTAHRQRIKSYGQIWEQLRTVAPGAYLQKGPQVAACYPARILRAAGDLDVVVRDQGPLWRAGTLLRDSGWRVETLTVMMSRTWRRDGYDLLMTLTRPSDTALPEPYEVELRTMDIATSTRYPLVRLPSAADEPLAASLIALVAERRERPYTSRDLLDLAMVSARMSQNGWLLVRQGLDAGWLWPQWREIRALLGPAGLSLPGAAPSQSRTARRRLRDRSRYLARWANPARAAGFLATTTVEMDRGRIADALAHALHERLGARRLLAAGVPLFGVPVGRDTLSTELDLVDHGRHLLARTPVGSFLLLAGSCPERWLTEVAAGSCRPAEPA
ncbi:MAG TPA: hypothetical protein VGS19_34800 [Streptosporangiaceae bacterium]|nr:hypothetical protein [Streptosporangiaceae bacterium]